jgi:hypothetical protein
MVFADTADAVGVKNRDPRPNMIRPLSHSPNIPILARSAEFGSICT